MKGVNYMTDVFCGADCNFRKDGKCSKKMIHLDGYEAWHACKDSYTTDQYREHFMSKKANTP